MKAQQFLVNEEWTTATGHPDTSNFALTGWDKFTWSASDLDSYGDLVTTGNTLVTAGNTDVLLTKYSRHGQMLWQKTFDGPTGGYDYGISVAIDNSNNIYVAGTTVATNGFLDYFIIKTNSSGSPLWTYTWNGSSGLHDVPSSIGLDNSGDVYVVGGSYDTQNGTDIALIKLSSSGSLLWQSIYDYAGLDDVPLPITDRSFSGTTLEVGAISASAQGQWDIATINFSITTGGISGETRTNVPELTLQEVYTFTTDDSGNVYLASISQGGSTGKDMEVVKVSSQGVEWVNTIDYQGLDDIPRSIVLDTIGNIFMSASAEKADGTDILTFKFDNDGNELWQRSYRAPIDQKTTRPVKIITDEAGYVYITGMVETLDGVQDYTTFMYDSGGTLRFEKKLDANNGSTDTPTDMILSASGNEIFVTGESTDAGGTEYVTVKYEIRQSNNEVVLENGEPHHKANELIVKFLPEFVNTTFVDDRTKRFGDIDEILPDTVITALENVLQFTLSKADVSKIFYRLTTAHQKSITRLGDTIDIPEFWSAFLFEFPAAENIDTLMARFNQVEEYVVYAEYNFVYEQHTLPNDFFFTNGDQASLWPTVANPNADINMDTAWDLETGQEYVRVGVFDGVLFWAHPDFGNGTFAGSQVAGGWDYFNNVDIVTIPLTNTDHGTKVAGIIGALRDNGLGIAGIAGGGLDVENNFNPGVQLFSMANKDWIDCDGDGVVDYGWVDCDGDGVLDRPNEIFFSSPAILQAIVEGAMFDPEATPTGFGLHVQNHSYGGPTFSIALEDVVYFTYRNQCAFVASRGNHGTDELRYPACYNDDWVMNVGASGDDGEWHGNNNGDIHPDPMITISWWNSAFGGGVDFVAPGVTDIVTSLSDTGNPDPDGFIDPGTGFNACNIAAINYDCFNGTSAAAPHVVGVVALMLSLHNVDKEGKEQWNNLAPEDVERLLESYADDVAAPNWPAGYDDNNGWGLINAGATIEVLEAPEWRVFHNQEPDQTVITYVGQEIYSDDYIFEKYRVQHTYHDVFSPSTIIQDGWRRLSSTIGFSESQITFQEHNATYEIAFNQNVADVTATTYCYEVIDAGNGQSDGWTPAPPNELRTAYSLHLHDPLATGIREEKETGMMEIFPNPSSGEFILSYNIPDSEYLRLYVYDALGKLILSQDLSTHGENTMNLDLTGYSSGVYLCQIIGDRGILSKQIIKQ